MTLTNKTHYSKELVCMNCGNIHTYRIPMGVEWEKHVKVCENCGCCRFSDYYKNIDNFRPTPKYDSPWLDNKLLCGNSLNDVMPVAKQISDLEQKGLISTDARGINVTPYNPVEQIRTYFQSNEGKDFLRSEIVGMANDIVDADVDHFERNYVTNYQKAADSIPKTDLQDVINKGGRKYGR